ncbi:MAG: hypothetical protein IPP71_21365 [Bacteroidetes bacterium]|nr:hypothetical protein [Bacteroidota bacterium]
MKNFTKFTLVIFILMLSHSISAQEWITSIKSENPTFFEIQSAFNNYWEGKIPEKGSGYKQFRRWEWFWKQRVGAAGVFPPSDILMTEWMKYNDKHGDATNERNSVAANWSFYGPSSSIGGYRGLGRINCMAFHPTNANTIWVGTAAGGIWKSTNGGTSWSTNSDYLPVLGVSDIAISNSNPNIMYIATGDGEAAFSLQNGYGDTKSVGILKSTDGGNTWNTTGLNWSVTSQKLIRRLLIDPSNNNILIAATSDGIYRTTNGGSSWSNQQSGWFMDLEFKPGDLIPYMELRLLHNLLMLKFMHLITVVFPGIKLLFSLIIIGLTWPFLTLGLIWLMHCVLMRKEDWEGCGIPLTVDNHLVSIFLVLAVIIYCIIPSMHPDVEGRETMIFLMR